MTSTASVREELLTHIPADTANFDAMAKVGGGLVDEITAQGQRFVDQAALQFDDLVHDCMETEGAAAANELPDEEDQEAAVDAASRSGSDINNAGLAAQIACIIAGNGLLEGTRMVREAAGLPTVEV